VLVWFSEREEKWRRKINKKGRDEKRRERREDSVVPEKDHYHLISINITFSSLLP